ncbi:TonB-dependent siderophore receptor, partial [Steroidobacter sp.]|uniref:TonB-dependent siderophore receptor n=1 Tax=Steroidobacter sp. TaxID=1978227 RepID=UPI001A40B73B
MKHLDAGRLAKLTLAAAVAWALPQASLAQSQQLSQALPRQPLADALDSLAKISGLQFVYSADLAAGITSQGAAAGRSVEEALREILRDTGLTYEFINERTVTIARSGLAPQSRNVDELLETVNVFGTLDTPLTVGSKTGQSLRETPKSVTIVTRERIEAQNLTTVTEAMQQATGITVRPYDPVQSWYYARGYRVDVTQLDGGAPITAGFGNFSSPDSAMFERIEVLRGVDGMFSGAGDPGGVINLVRKRALRSPALNVTASAGSWNNYRLELDATGSLARDGQMRGRAVGVFEDKEYFWDRADSNKKMVYGVLENDIGSDIVVSVGGVYENRRDNGYWYGGVPRYADGRDLHLSRTRSLVPDWGFSETTTKEVFAKLDYDIRDNLALAMNVTYQDQQSESLTAYVKGAINPVTLTGASFTSWANDTPSERAAVDLHLKGSFELFGREHKFAVGGDYSKSDGGGARFFYMMGYPFVNGPTVDVFNFNPSLLPRPNRVLNPAAFTNRISPVYGQVQYGGYATLGLQLADPLRLTIGGRYTNYEQEEQSYR